MITQEKLKDMSRVAGLIIDDCETDAKKLDGMPFTGRTVATLFGEQLAVMQALAKMVKELADGQIEET